MLDSRPFPSFPFLSSGVSFARPSQQFSLHFHHGTLLHHSFAFIVVFEFAWDADLSFCVMFLCSLSLQSSSLDPPHFGTLPSASPVAAAVSLSAAPTLAPVPSAALTVQPAAPVPSVLVSTTAAPMDVSVDSSVADEFAAACASHSAAAASKAAADLEAAQKADAAPIPLIDVTEPESTSAAAADQSAQQRSRGRRGRAGAAAAATATPAASVPAAAAASGTAENRKRPRTTTPAAPASHVAAAATSGSSKKSRSSASHPAASATPAAASASGVVMSPSGLVALRASPSEEVLDLRDHDDVLLLGPELSLLRPCATGSSGSAAAAASSSSSSSSLVPVAGLFTGDGRAFSGFLVSTDQENDAPNVCVLMHGEIRIHEPDSASQVVEPPAAAGKGKNKKSKAAEKAAQAAAAAAQAPASTDDRVVAAHPPKATLLDTVAYPSAFRALLQCYLELQKCGVALKSLCCACCGHAQYSQVSCESAECSFSACPWCAAQYFGGAASFPSGVFKTLPHAKHQQLSQSIQGRYMYRPIPTLVLALCGYQFDDFLSLFESELVNSGCAPCGYGVFWEVRCFSTLAQLKSAVAYFASRAPQYAGIEQVLIIIPLHQDVLRRLLVTESFTVMQQHMASPELFPLFEADEKTPAKWRAKQPVTGGVAPGSAASSFTFLEVGSALRPLLQAFRDLHPRPVVYVDLVTCQVSYESLSEFGVASGLRDEVYEGLVSYLQPCPLALYIARMRSAMPVFTCHDPAPVLQVGVAPDVNSPTQHAAGGHDVPPSSQQKQQQQKQQPPARSSSPAPPAFLRRVPYDRVLCMAQSAISQINLRSVYLTPARGAPAAVAAASRTAVAHGASAIPPASSAAAAAAAGVKPKPVYLVVPTSAEFSALNIKGDKIPERCGFRVKPLTTVNEALMRTWLRPSPSPPAASPSPEPQVAAAAAAPASQPKSSTAAAAVSAAVAAPAAAASSSQFSPLPTDDAVVVGLLRATEALQRDIHARRVALQSALAASNAGASAQQSIDLTSPAPLCPIPSLSDVETALQSLPTDPSQIRLWQGRIGSIVTQIASLRRTSATVPAGGQPPPPPPPPAPPGPGGPRLPPPPPPFGNPGGAASAAPHTLATRHGARPPPASGSARSVPTTSPSTVSGGPASAAPAASSGSAGVGARSGRMPVVVPPSASLPLPPSSGQAPHRGSLPALFEPPVFPLVMPHIRLLLERESLLPVGLRRWTNEWQCMEYFCHRASLYPSLALPHWTLYGQIINYGKSADWYQRLMDDFSPLGPQSELSEYQVRCHLAKLHPNDPAAVEKELQELRDKLKAAKSPRSTPYQKQKWGPSASTQAFKGRTVHPPNVTGVYASSSAAAAAGPPAVSFAGAGAAGAAGNRPAAPPRPHSALNSAAGVPPTAAGVASSAASGYSRFFPSQSLGSSATAIASAASWRALPLPNRRPPPPAAVRPSIAPPADSISSRVDGGLSDDALLAALEEAESRLPHDSVWVPPPRSSALRLPPSDALWPVQQQYQQQPPSTSTLQRVPSLTTATASTLATLSAAAAQPPSSPVPPLGVMPVREDARMQATHVSSTSAVAASRAASVVSASLVAHSTAASAAPPDAPAASTSAVATSAPSAKHADGQVHH